ncbi:SEC-C metal-binding domain-containing protein [Serratia marcescens]|uniref:SEC-C metal-binding domain-containing protein n=1 Tax=Serratia marcescens TaxID=615 RepID=UPI002361A44D|nr:SEC-C metal-binding domain-containing protein [Serratia marcescens]MDX7539264.1 SEC-C metal-binding domain-containing protein [Serratia marcescens]
MYGLKLNTLKLSFNPEAVLHEILCDLSNRNYNSIDISVKELISSINSSKEKTSSEQEKNEGYIWSVFFTLFIKVASFWREIERKNYYDSWVSLQDALDTLRQVKKFYRQESIVIDFFEKQLLSLEKLYPYTIFSSIGFIEDGHECSICKNDMDSDKCEHLKGELYSGEVAYAIVRKIERLDHLALVYTPLDKRLVVGINDSHPSFSVFSDLMSFFDNKKMNPVNFTEAVTLDFKKKNPQWVKAPRNSMCSCGSGLKYKKCCIANEFVEQRHVEFRPFKLI